MNATTTQGLLGPADLRRLAQALAVSPTKALGQNFVVDANTVRRIVARRGARPGRRRPRGRPGLGSLTLALLDAAAARRRRRDRPASSPPRCPRTVAERRPDAADRLEVRHAGRAAGDRAARPASPPRWWRTCPTTSPFPCCCTVLERFPTLRHGLVMVQAEVAERLAAAPGEPGLRRAVGQGGLVRRACAGPASIGPTVFWPVPNVDSGLVAFTRREPPATAAGRAAVFAVRRRRLRAAPQDAAGRAAPGWAGSPDAAERALRAAGIDPRTRGEQLDVERVRPAGRARLAAASSPARPWRERHARVTVRAPAKVNLRLAVGAAAAGRLPRRWPRCSTPCRCTTRSPPHRRGRGRDVTVR